MTTMTAVHPCTLCAALCLLMLTLAAVVEADRDRDDYGRGNWCYKLERRFANSYRCIDRPNNLLCWTMVKVLERRQCKRSCTEYSGQQCMAKGRSCSKVDALCPRSKQCCSVD